MIRAIIRPVLAVTLALVITACGSGSTTDTSPGASLDTSTPGLDETLEP